MLVPFDAPQSDALQPKISAQPETSLQDSMRDVWEQHRPGMLDRVTLIEQAVRALSAGELSRQRRDAAQRSAHTLAGSMAMFGFTRTPEVARVLEQELERSGPERVPMISTLVAIIRRELEAGWSPVGRRPERLSLPGPSERSR